MRLGCREADPSEPVEVDGVVQRRTLPESPRGEEFVGAPHEQTKRVGDLEPPGHTQVIWGRNEGSQTGPQTPPKVNSVSCRPFPYELRPI